MSLNVRLIHNNYTKSRCACLSAQIKWKIVYFSTKELFLVYFTLSFIFWWFESSQTKIWAWINTRCGGFMCIKKYNSSFLICSHHCLHIAFNKKQATNEFVIFSLVIWPYLTFFENVLGGRIFNMKAYISRLWRGTWIVWL